MKLFITFSTLMVLLLLSFGQPVVAANNDCGDEEVPVKIAGCTIDGTSNESGPEVLDNTINEIINILAIIAGVAAVIVIIVQGLRLVLSGGNSQTAGQARNGIIYALIGLVVIISAQQIVLYVVDHWV